MKITLVRNTESRIARKGNIKTKPITDKITSTNSTNEPEIVPIKWNEYLTETKADKLAITDMFLYLEYRVLLQSDVYANYCRAIRAGREHKKAKLILADIEPEYKHIQSVYSFWGDLGGANQQAFSFSLWLRDNAYKVNQLTSQHIAFNEQSTGSIQINLPEDYQPTHNVEKLKQALAKALNKELHYQKSKRAKINDQANLYRIEQALDIYYLKKYHNVNGHHFNGHQCAEVIKVSNKKCWQDFMKINFSAGIIMSKDITPLITELTTDAEQIITSALNGTFPFFKSSKAQSKYY